MSPDEPAETEAPADAEASVESETPAEAEGHAESGESNETASSESAVAESEASGFGPGTEDVFRYLTWGGLVLCIILVVFAGLRVYSGVGAFISLWVASKYEPIVSAGFNLSVLLVAAYGVTKLSRRLTSSG